jgi:MFS family permease
VNIALPLMASAFRVPPATVQWVSIGYLLPIAALALPTGRWLDLVGRRQALVTLVIGFVVMSAAAGAAPSFAALLVARIAQGAFGAGLFAVTPIVAFESVRPQRRGAAVAAMSAIGAAGGVAGPSLGAFVTQLLGWPWIFWCGIPVLLATLPVFVRLLPAGAPLVLPSRTLLGEAVLLAAAVSAVLLGLTFAADRAPVWGLLVIAAAPALLVWRRLHPDSPVLALVKRPGFSPAVVSLASLAASVLAAQYLLAFLAERTLGLSPVAAGAALLALPAATMPCSLAGSALARRIRPERVSAAGFVLLAVGIASGVVAGSLGGLVLAAILMGAGQGLSNPPATYLGMSFAGSEQGGSAGAAMSFLRNIGFTAGPAAVSVVWALGGYSLPSLRWALVLAAAFALFGGLVVLRTAPAAARLRRQDG